MNRIEQALRTFENNLAKIDKLLHFDENVIELVLKELKTLRERLVKIKDFPLDNSMVLPDRSIKILSQLKEHGSTSLYYKIMYNQSVVMLISYFASAINDILALIIYSCLKNMDADSEETNEVDNLKKEKLRPSVFELAQLLKGDNASIGEYIITQTNISTQDMQSISKALKTYASIFIEQDNTVNNIILGHAARHIIVHNGGIINAKFKKQISKATPRDLKNDELAMGQEIEFTPEDVLILSGSLKGYLNTIVSQLKLANDDIV